MLENAKLDSINIILVEDNLAEQELLRSAFAEVGFPVLLTVVRDGLEALELIEHRMGYSPALEPNLIILDLGLPHVDGLQVLKRLNESEKAKTLPVFVLTGSDNLELRRQVEKLGPSVFLKKPNCTSEYQKTAKTIRDSWYECNLA